MHGITCVNFIYTDEHCAGQRPGDQPATRSAQLAVRGGEQVEGDAQALPGIQGLFRRIQRYHRGGPVPAQSHLPFPHPSVHCRLGSGTSPAARALRAVPPVEISSTPRSEIPLARLTSYASLDYSFAQIVRAYILLLWFTLKKNIKKK